MSQKTPSDTRNASMKDKPLTNGDVVAQRLRSKDLRMSGDDAIHAAEAGKANFQTPVPVKNKTTPKPDGDAAEEALLPLAKDTEEQNVSERSSDSDTQTWTVAQASVPTAEVVEPAAAACSDKAPSRQDCDDDKGVAWWHQGTGGWLKIGLAGAGVWLGAKLLNKDETADLETGMAAGPFKASGMTLQYFGTSGLLLELSWDENGDLTVDTHTALEGDVQVHTSFVDMGNDQRVEVVTGVSVKFATYTGALLAVLVDVVNDDVPVEYYDEVAGLMALEGGSLSAFTTIKTGQNTLAITPFTELALRKANIDIDSLLANPATASASMAQLLNNSTQTTAIQTAIEEVNTLVGVDITQVLPTALNDEAYASETDTLAKLYGEKLASLSRLVPGNLEGGLERLLNATPADVPTLLNAALEDYKDDNDLANPQTPPSVTLQRPWVNAVEGAQPLWIRGTSTDADDGSVVRISISKNGVQLLSLRAEVSDNEWSVQLTQTLQELGVADGESLTIKAYIDPDHPAQVEIVYDATAPAAPVSPPNLLATDDTGRNDSDNDTSTVRPHLHIGELPEEGMTVELLVDGEVVPATYVDGVLQPASALSEGVHALSYRYIDRAGNRSEGSAPLALNVDTAGPQAVASFAPLSHDSGTSASDWITNVAAQTVSATLSGPLNNGEILRASLDGGATWTDITAAVNGTAVSWTGVTLRQGTSSVQFQVVDAAGNAGAVRSQAYTLDTTAPATPSAAPDLQAASDTRIDTDNITSQTRPVLDVLALPADAVAVELLVNGQVVSAAFDGHTLRPNASLSDATHALSYRFVDAAGNRSEASATLSVTVDSRAPQATAITNVAAGGISGTYEVGSTIALSIAGVPVTGVITTNANGTWSYVPTTPELSAMRAPGAISELLLTVTDVAGNRAQNSRTVTADDLSGPYIKEWIPADNGTLANGPDGFATLNLVFSKPVTKSTTGSIKVYDLANHLIATVPVSSDDVRIEGEGRNDVYVSLPGLSLNTGYYVTIDAGAFVDSNQEPFLGQLPTGLPGWNFTSVAASIAPDFVAADDMINARENNGTVSISGKIVSSTAILAAIDASDLSLDVRDVNNAVVPHSNRTYNANTGVFSFSVAANAWSEGAYHYTVSLRGTTGAATGVNADYNFTNLAVDLTAPTMSASVQGALDDAGRLTGELWANASSAVTDDISPYISGVLNTALTADARVVVYRSDVTDPNNRGDLVRITGPEGLKPTGLNWSLGDSALLNGHTYEYVSYVEDAAGNRSQASVVKTLAVDTSAPTAQVTGLTLSQDSGISNTDRITNIASQTLSGSLSAALGAGETLLASLDGGITWTNITASVSGATFSVPGITLPAGTAEVRFQVQDAAGNAGTETRLGFTLDQTPPNAPTAAPDLLTASDSGTSGTDNITRETRPHLVIGVLPSQVAGAQLLVDGEVVNATYNGNDGTLRPAQALSHGPHNFSYRWVDAAGNVGPAGPALAATVDTVAPTVRMANMDISADSGSSASDFVTNVAAQTVTGQLNGMKAADDKVFGSVDGGTNWLDITSMVNSNGQLTWSGVTLSAGVGSLQFKLVDVAGNEGVISQQGYNLDRSAPGTTAAQIDINADTGTSASDFITKQATQTVTGRLVDGDELSTLDAGDRLMASSNGGTTWQDITSTVNGDSFTWTNVSLSNGENSLRFKVVDAAGNEGAVSRQNYTLDTVAPAAPQNFAWATYPNGINTGTNTVSGTIGDVPFTYTLTKLDQSVLNLNATSNMYNQGLFPTAYNVPNATSIRNDVASINQLTFDSPLSNPVLAFSSIGNPGNPVTISFPVPVEILWSTDVTVNQGATNAATRVTGREGFMVVRLNGTVDEFRFDYLSNETYVNFAFGAAVFDLLSADQDTGVKSIDDITQTTRPAFQVQNKPSDAVAAELLIDGRFVAATFNATDNTLTPDIALADGVYQVSYRFIDIAGNASASGSVTQVTIDTRAPVDTALTTFTQGAIGGTYEPGTALSLKINGVTIASNRLLLDATVGTWSLVPTSTELNDATTGLLVKASSTFELVATDPAGNTTTANKTVAKDVFNAPYVKEFIPADSGVLANDATGHATLNLVFSKAVSAGTGKVKLWNSSNTLVTEIDVTSNAVRIENGTDVYVTLPALTNGVSYYVTLDAGTFVDNADQSYAGKTETGSAGWDFVGALASIAPNFVAQDDIVNAAENTAVVTITGKVVGSAAILEDIVAGNLTVSVTAPQGAPAVTATLLSYNNQTGEFVFNVPAQAWANGSYGYSVRLRGTAGDAASVNADYNFANLAVDLIAPTSITSSLDSIMDNVGVTQGNLFPTSVKLLDSGFATQMGTVKVTDSNVTDLDLSQISAKMAGAYVPGQVAATYNTGSTVYNSDRTSVSFWVQMTDAQYTKAVKLQLTDVASGIELKILSAKYLPGVIATTFNWNNPGGSSMGIATSLTGGGYGLNSLEFAAGTQGNGLTDDNTPTLGGTLTRVLAQGEHIAIDRTNEQGQTLTITGKDGLIVDGTTWAFNDGTLADGQYTYRVYVEDTAGNRTASSTARTITVDSGAPTAVVTAATLSQDTGTSSSDRLTKVAAQTITGTLSAALGSGEKLMASFDGGTTFVDITSMVSGTSFNWTGVTLREGSNAIRWQVVDAMGNRGTSWDQTFTLDTTGPAAPSAAPDLLTADDDGSSNSDNTTTVQKPRLVVGALPVDVASVELLVDGVAVAATYDAASQTLTPTNNLAYGSRQISYRYTDMAGNVGTASADLALDLSAPVVAYTPPAPVAFTSPQIGGARVAILGDLNNDGYQDYAMGARSSYDLRVILGGDYQSASGLLRFSDIPNNSGTVIPRALSSLVTDAVAGLGDFNGDGQSDFSTSGFWNAVNEINFIMGATSSVNVTETFDMTINSWGSYANRVFGLGDVNGDGLNDLGFLGYNGDGQQRGGVIYGRTSTTDISFNDLVAGNGGYLVKAVAQAPYNYATFAYSGDGIGDANGDGRSDVAWFDAANGTYYLEFTNQSTRTGTTTTTISNGGGIVLREFTAPNSHWNLHSGNNNYPLDFASSAGDFNGDGYADMMVADAAWSSGKGRVAIVFGGQSAGTITAADIMANPGQRGFVIEGTALNAKLGVASSSIGDINGDGLADVAISAPTNGVYVVYGRASNATIDLNQIASGIGGFKLTGGQYLGSTVSNGGDINGDGLNDFVVSSDSGVGMVVFGGSSAVSELKVSVRGTNAADTLSDGNTSKTLVAGLGNDTLTAHAASVLYGGAGNDTFEIGAAMATALQNPMGLGGNVERLARIDGGAGQDILRLLGNVNLDLTMVANQAASLLQGGSRIDSIETIDLNTTGENSLKLTVLDLIDMGSANTFATTGRQQLMVKGGAGDTVQLMDTNAVGVWTLASANVTLDGTEYHVLNHNTAAATLYVQVGVAVTDFVAGTPGVEVIDPGWVVNASNLTIDYSAADKSGWIMSDNYRNNDWDYSDSYKTDNDDVFAYDFSRIYWDDDPEAGNLRWELKSWQIGQGDRIKGATLLGGFDGAQQIDVPSTFGSVAGGDDQIDNNQFEVYYGTYTLVNGDYVFTVISTEEFANSQTEIIGGSTNNTLSVATHTLILFDNDSQSRSSNTLNNLLSGPDHASYLPDQAYRETYDGSEVYLSHPYWLDAAVVSGVYHEKGWALTKDADGTNQKLGWEAQPDYISIGRLDADQTAFGAWFDTNENGMRDDGEEAIDLDLAANLDTMDYSYTLSGVDFAAGHYTVRFVDPVMSVDGQPPVDMKVPDTEWDWHGTLRLDEMAFRDDDLLIIDQQTNASAWTDWTVTGATGDLQVTLNSSDLGDVGAIAYLGVPIVLDDNLKFLAVL